MKRQAVYKQIITDIENGIKSGELKPGQKLESDSVYAERYNVSRNTVIKAFDTLKISGLVRRVQGGSSYVARIDTNQNGFTRNEGHDNIISLVLPLLANDMLRTGDYSLACGVESVLRENRYCVLLSGDIEYADEQMSFINYSRQRNSCGAIIYPTIAERSSVMLLNLILDKFPVVFIDRRIGYNNVPCVSSDNEKGGVLAARHLVERGFTDMFYVSDSSIDVTRTLRERFFGFCSELRRNGVHMDERQLIQGFSIIDGVYVPTTYESSPELFRDIVKRLTESVSGRVGIFACNDAIAYSLIRAALDIGIDVPERMGVVGFDDAGFSQMAAVPITTIKQDFMKIGREAARIMLALQRGEEVNNNTVIDVELVVRKST